VIWPFGRKRRKEEPEEGKEEHTATLTVPDDVRSIQEAIASAPEGATVVVRPGRYRGDVDFSGKNLKVRSNDPRDPQTVARTIIEGDGDGTVVAFVRGEGEGSELAGFTITGGHARVGGPGEGGGITVRGHARPVIENNVIEGNRSDLDGGGIYIDDAAPAVLRNQIRDNAADGCGGGIHVGRDSVRSSGYQVEPAFRERMGQFLDRSMPRTIQITASEDDSEHAFRDEAAGDIQQEREKEERPRPVLEGNTIQGNRALWGGGLFVSDEAPRVDGNVFRANSAGRGGGVCIWDNSRAVLLQNMLIQNEAEEEGGAVIVEWGASPVLLANRITGTRSRRGALSVATNSAPIIRNNVFSDNEGVEGDVLHLWKSNLAVLQDNQFAGDR